MITYKFLLLVILWYVSISFFFTFVLILAFRISFLLVSFADRVIICWYVKTCLFFDVWILNALKTNVANDAIGMSSHELRFPFACRWTASLSWSTDVRVLWFGYIFNLKQWAYISCYHPSCALSFNFRV